MCVCVCVCRYACIYKHTCMCVYVHADVYMYWGPLGRYVRFWWIFMDLLESCGGPSWVTSRVSVSFRGSP